MNNLNKIINWVIDVPAHDWDNNIAVLGGHPLQSTLWGRVRQLDGIKDFRWAALYEGKIIFMVRFEVRYMPLIGQFAWIPKGPVFTADLMVIKAYNELLSRLSSFGYTFCIQDPYLSAPDFIKGSRIFSRPRTILIDLKLGEEKLFAALDSQWRYGVRLAERTGITVEHSRKQVDIDEFFYLCRKSSRKKGFYFPFSKASIQELIVCSQHPQVEAKLFIARYQAHMAAAAIVLRCGNSLHYFFGATNRNFSKHRPSEALQWKIIEWAIKNGLKVYDLEGVDAVKNPGVYHFKRKMGGVELELPGKYAYPFCLRGRLAISAGRLLRRV